MLNYSMKLEKIFNIEGLEINIRHNIQVPIENNFYSLHSGNRSDKTINTCSQLSFNYLKEFSLPDFLTSYQDPTATAKVGNYSNKVIFYSSNCQDSKTSCEDNKSTVSFKSSKSPKSLKSSKSRNDHKIINPKDHLKLDIMVQIHRFMLKLPHHRKTYDNYLD